jgi:2-iminoacetate synthase
MLNIKDLTPVIDETLAEQTLEKNARPDDVRFNEILAKARACKGLDADDIASLATTNSPEQLEQLFQTAQQVKDFIYGRRLVLFAPLYISNLCGNECIYCAFRAKNTAIKRRALTQEEIKREVETLVDQGHKRVLLVAGESYPQQGFGYVLDSVATIYSVKRGNGEIRRVNVNVAPLSVEEFVQLKNTNIGTYQIFQETYHHATYANVHVGGKKRDYDWRIGALHRAMAAGINDVGIGVLFGLYDWKFELLAMVQHIRDLEKKFGVGPHTISVPRIEPATGSALATHPPHVVSDIDFKKIVAILRLAVPYTGIIMSTRENAVMRRDTFALGVSQISAGSRTNPGGYASSDLSEDDGQFSLGDHRELDTVIRDVASMGYIPSFCTGCYRLGRTGADFMDLARPGDIKAHCDPNAVSTFAEYLIDYGSSETKTIGEALISKVLGEMTGVAKERTAKMVQSVREGKRDVLC